MPEPIGKYASDRLIYTHICNPLSKQLCGVDPSFITFLGLLSVIPIVKNLYYNGSTQHLVFWLALRALLDCLDGAVARNCNKESHQGAVFDISSDLLCASLISLIVIKHTWNTKYKFFVIILSMFLMSNLVINWYHTINGNEKVGLSKDEYGLCTFFHDNTVLLAIAGPLLIKHFLKTL
jgi:phosphatidylglycerophosphate synthase